jgi:hypothetical protein
MNDTTMHPFERAGQDGEAASAPPAPRYAPCPGGEGTGRFFAHPASETFMFLGVYVGFATALFWGGRPPVEGLAGFKLYRFDRTPDGDFLHALRPALLKPIALPGTILAAPAQYLLEGVYLTGECGPGIVPGGARTRTAHEREIAQAAVEAALDALRDRGLVERLGANPDGVDFDRLRASLTIGADPPGGAFPALPRSPDTRVDALSNLFRPARETWHGEGRFQARSPACPAMRQAAVIPGARRPLSAIHPRA